ncbi:MAG: ADOP family duplicated permease [Terriglobales bacterium]
MLREVRLALRQLRRRRGVSAAAVVLLALALGANTAMFSVLDGFLLHPLPYRQPGQLVWFLNKNLKTGATTDGGALSLPDFIDYRAQTHGLQSAAYWFPADATLWGRGSPHHVAWAGVTAGFFKVLGVKPALGSGILPSDEAPAPMMAVLSNALWRNYFGADPNIVGKKFNLDTVQYVALGVMPAGFDFPQGTDLWCPQAFTPTFMQLRGYRFLSAVGRLDPGSSQAAAQAQLDGEARRLAQQFPATNSNQGLKLEPLTTVFTGPVRATVDLMFLAAVLVLAVACANVASLLMTGAVGRWREMALRTSLGASRSQLARQLLVEALVLALGAGVLGWLLAAAALPLIRLAVPQNSLLVQPVHLDLRVLGYTAGATLAVAICFWLAPLWELLRARPGRSLLREAEGGVAGRSRLPAFIVVAEVAATVVLLIGAGLLMQSVRRLDRVGAGFQPDHVLSFRLALLAVTNQQITDQWNVFTHLDQRMQALPGVEAAGGVDYGVFTPAPQLMHFYRVGDTVGAGLPLSEQISARNRMALPGYFEAMGIPVRGRTFTMADDRSREYEVILSADVAHDLFPQGGAIGQAVVAGGRTYKIIGVAANLPAHVVGGTPARDFYSAYLQYSIGPGETDMVVRAQGDPRRLIPAIRRQLHDLNPKMAMFNIELLQDRTDATIAPQHARAELLLAMAVLTLVLALVGLYAVLSHTVALRRREIGIRMAVGASAEQVRAMVLWQSLRMIFAGVALGLLASWWLSGALEHLLYGASAGTAASWLIAPPLMILVGLAASYWPARRAARLDPALTLRAD